jgi:hypothetical protein
VVVSKALRKVDQETRREIRDKRLLALEADNYAVELSVEAEEDYSEEVRRILFPFNLRSRKRIQLGRGRQSQEREGSG